MAAADVFSKRLIRAADVNYSMPALLYVAMEIAAVLLVAYPRLVGLTANGRNVVVLAGARWRSSRRSSADPSTIRYRVVVNKPVIGNTPGD